MRVTLIDIIKEVLGSALLHALCYIVRGRNTGAESQPPAGLFWGLAKTAGEAFAKEVIKLILGYLLGMLYDLSKVVRGVPAKCRSVDMQNQL